MKPSLRPLLPALAAILIPICSFADTEITNGVTWTYSLSGTNATVTGANPASGDLAIPSTLGSYPVTSIGSWAFENCSGLTSVTIPDSVTSIGWSAFVGCSGLMSIIVDNGNSAYDSRNGCNAIIETASGTLVAGCSNTIIPDGITSIGDHAFSHCSGLTSVTIPDSVTSIGWSAFAGCSKLSVVSIPDSVTNIEGCAFFGCSRMTSITIPAGVTSIGEEAFVDCYELTMISISDNVTSIGEKAFSGCSKLTESWVNVTDMSKWATNSINASLPGIRRLFMNGEEIAELLIPEGVNTIGEYAFSNCSGLTSVAIADSVTRVERNAFTGCSGLTSITIGAGISSMDNIPHFVNDCFVSSTSEWFSAFDGIVFSRNGETLIFFPAKRDGSYSIPSNVTSIGESAFSDCSGLTSITISEGVTSIESYAFADCSGLTSITIPDNVTSVGEGAFYGCSGLTSITIPNNVTNLGKGAFYCCSGLTSITIPDSVTSIGDYVFSRCSGLTSITIPDGVTSIGDYAFYDCSGLTSITIPDGVTCIGDHAFLYCGLAEVHISDLEAWCSISFNGYYANPCSYAHHLFLNGEEITDLEIPDGVTNIGNSAFAGCSGLTSITIPDSVTSIGEGAFSSCSGLTSITIPDSVMSIGDYAFSGCSNLETVYLAEDYSGNMPWPSNVTVIRYATVTFDPSPSTLISNISIKVWGENAVYGPLISSTIPDPPVGYSFGGWALYGEIVGPDTIVVEMTNHVLTATWTPNEYEVSFNAAGGMVDPVSKTVTFNAAYGALPEPSRTGFVFANWSLDGEPIEPKSIVSMPGDHTLTALWWPAWTLHFDGNGGEGSMSDQSISIPAAISPNLFTHDGFFFLGWALAPDGEAVLLDGDSTAEIEAEAGETITLYAVWHEGVGGKYLVLDLNAGSAAESYSVSCLVAAPDGGFNTDEYKTTKLVLRRIEPGSFIMGGGSDESHGVTLTMPFYCGVFEVTQKQYELVTGSNPSYYRGDKRPVEQVSWNTIRGDSGTYNWPSSANVNPNSFMGRLRARTGLDFDLPTEAQWEYVCRAGTTTDYNNGTNYGGDFSNDPNLNLLGRYRYNRSDGKGGHTDAHTVVGSYQPNAWDLYDMHGNVWEWCLDWYGMLEYGADPKSPSSGSGRVHCGGGWGNPAYYCTSSYVHDSDPSISYNDVGFRLVLPSDVISTYAVRFDANGGEGAMPKRIYASGDDVEIPGGAFSREGYTLVGWATEPDGVVTLPPDGTLEGGLKSTPGETVTLYARWSLGTYAVHFDANGGAGEMADQSLWLGVPEALNSNCVTKVGYTHSGWMLAGGDYSVIADKAVVLDLATAVGATATLEAIWTANSYTIRFDANGGNGTMEATAAIYDEKRALPQNAFVRDNRAFAGWATEADGLIVYTNGADVINLIATADGVATLYAVWGYEVSFDPTGGTVAPESKVVTFDAAYGELPTPVRSGYVFLDWRLDGAAVDASTIVQTAEDHTLAARWGVAVGNGVWEETIGDEPIALGAPETAPTGAVEIPAEIAGRPVVAIGAEAFAENAAIASIVVPESVTNIADGAFAGCSELETLCLPLRFGVDADALSIPSTCAVVYRGTLSVSSAHGNPVPGVGTTNLELSGSPSLACSVDGVEDSGDGVRYVCAGWTGTGMVPASGAGTNATVVLTENATLTWHWTTNVWAECIVTGDATSDGLAAWLEKDGASATVSFTPDGEPFTVALSGDTDGVVLDTDACTVSIPADRPRSVGVSVCFHRIDNAVETGAAAAWTSGADADGGWHVAADPTAADGYSLRSDEIAASQTAAAQVSLPLAGTLSFDWRVSTAARRHFAYYYVDGERKTQDRITGETDWATVTLELGDGPHTIRWTYEKSNAAASGDDAAFLDNVRWNPLTLPEALDETNVVWTTEGGADWTPQLSVSADGRSAARSGALVGEDTSRLVATVDGPGTLAWKWKTDVEDLAGVDVYLDGTMLDEPYLMDEPDWTDASLAIEGDGPHRVEFRFWNGGTEATISDCAYIDCASWCPVFVRVEGVAVPTDWIRDRAAEFVAAADGDVFAAARATASNGVNRVWQCYVAGLDPSSATDRLLATISIDGNGEPAVAWTPDLAGARDYVVDGKSSLTNEWGVWDGDSRFFRVRVAMPGGFGSFLIAFDSAGGTPVDPISTDYGAPVVAPDAPTKAGHSFAGWSPPLPATMPAHDLSLRALWSANRYTITFDGAGGSSVASITADYGAPVFAPAAPTRDGYAFAGWSPEFPATMPLDGAALTAQWTANRYSVHFEPGEGTGTMEDQSFYYGVTQSLSRCTFANGGHSFAGWATNANGEVVYADGALVENLATEDDAVVTLWAVWTESLPGLAIRYYDIDSSGYSIWTQSESAMEDYFAGHAPTIATNTLAFGSSLEPGFTSSSQLGDSDQAKIANFGMTAVVPGVCRFHGKYASEGTEYFATFLSGSISVAESGGYSFAAIDDDYIVIYVDGTKVANAQWGDIASGSMALDAGMHSISIGYYEITGGQGFTVQWKKPGDTSYAPIPQSVLSH